MSRLRFDVQWHDGVGIEGPELAATMASLRISAGGSVLTEADDRRAQTLRDSVYLPLYPLAEWLASNWWFLAYEAENRLNRADPAFAHRHSLVTGAEGYAFPDVSISSTGRSTHIAWRTRSSAWNQLDFRSCGEVTVDRDEFLQSCTELIETVVRRLAARGVTSTFLQSEWATIGAADEDELAFCATAAGLGRDPYDLDEDAEQLILSVGELLGDLREEALPAIDAAEPLAACEAIRDAFAEARPNEMSLQSGLQHADGHVRQANRPWQAGYQLARRARQVLGLNGELIASNADLAEAIGHDPATLERVTRPMASLRSLGLIDGVVRPVATGAMSCGLRAAGETGRRFLFCRALCEALTASTDALLTKAGTERQRRSRAFAAEFLAPAVSLRERISDGCIDRDQVADLAEEFGVSTYVIEHQIENHDIAELVVA